MTFCLADRWMMNHLELKTQITWMQNISKDSNSNKKIDPPGIIEMVGESIKLLSLRRDGLLKLRRTSTIAGASDVRRRMGQTDRDPRDRTQPESPWRAMAEF